jgi:hypothetical protein
MNLAEINGTISAQDAYNLFPNVFFMLPNQSKDASGQWVAPLKIDVGDVFLNRPGPSAQEKIPVFRAAVDVTPNFFLGLRNPDGSLEQPVKNPTPVSATVFQVTDTPEHAQMLNLCGAPASVGTLDFSDGHYSVQTQNGARFTADVAGLHPAPRGGDPTLEKDDAELMLGDTQPADPFPNTHDLRAVGVNVDPTTEQGAAFGTASCTMSDGFIPGVAAADVSPSGPVAVLNGPFSTQQVRDAEPVDVPPPPAPPM